MAKPDNRADNAIHLRNAIKNTKESISEAEAYLDEHADEIGSEEEEAITDKNARRRNAIKRFKQEIPDES
ncbi:small acid-soluble spore protein Tlp [Cohnella lubricantis]|uniref:Small acid-soluble spore protein Tlp n=1 Tax=Cohnella lubricantis TaxID=2163172 RepID=A0A841TM65_9BACL|nr:small acid-soluble spore protein Tlp [Cohnella lubricantis]MBB6679621.1 small acid-soluble spore protein Tlp [Cohnella lubricantis]MBP2118605.1 small acid-soluble spore protein (thioredoxin-like protein) [Cohnella lubricantis]